MPKKHQHYGKGAVPCRVGHPSWTPTHQDTLEACPKVLQRALFKINFMNLISYCHFSDTSAALFEPYEHVV